ncbi:MAG: hypothetical protein NZ585_00965 [Chloracidobacterium sp.]|nr:hypothetical protein [Chloracidobacterium sp.]MDW8216422.1 hypothetical protein [Acidobacteriota bacterium]
MTSLKVRVAATAVRLALWHPRWAWRVVRWVTPPALLVRRWWARLRPSPEARLLETLTQELAQAVSGENVDWRDVYALGELCIRRHAYAEAALHFRRVALAAQAEQELRRSAASWLGRALEYAGDLPGARAAYRAYLAAFPEISRFERQRLERRLAELDGVSIEAAPAAEPFPASAFERPSRLAVGRRR